MAEKKAFALRLSPQLWEALQRAASQDFRSINGEIEALLTEALAGRGRIVPFANTDLVPHQPDREMGPES